MTATDIAAAHQAGNCANRSADGRSCTCSNEIAALADTSAAPATDFHSLYLFFQNNGMGRVTQETDAVDRRRGMQVISYPYKVGQSMHDQPVRHAAAIDALKEAGYRIHEYTSPRGYIHILTNA